jgi:uncharacterized sporulation protein YeaH/YhbH (DUF444 family)
MGNGLRLKETVEISGSVTEVGHNDIILLANVVLNESKKYEIGRTGSFREILESLKRKIDVLPYINDDETYEKIKEEILIDFAKIICKLEYKQKL